MKINSLGNNIKDLRLAFSNWGFTWHGFFLNSHGEWWLVAQILVIAAHFIKPSTLITLSPNEFSVGLNILGSIIMVNGSTKIVRSFWRLGPNLSPLPDPKPGSKHVRTGIYSQCRHPLYQGLIITSLGVNFIFTSLLHLGLFIALTLLLIGKARREEKELKKIHIGYSDYIAITPAIVSRLPGLDWRD